MNIFHGSMVDVGTVDLHHSVVGAFDDRISLFIMTGMTTFVVCVIRAHEVRLKSAFRISKSIHQFPWQMIII